MLECFREALIQVTMHAGIVSEIAPALVAPTRLAEKNYVVVTFIIVAASVVAKGIYNRYLHPLRHFPGPFWGSVSDFYKLYVIAKKDAHTRGVKMHKKYGTNLFHETEDLGGTDNR